MIAAHWTIMDKTRFLALLLAVCVSASAAPRSSGEGGLPQASAAQEGSAPVAAHRGPGVAQGDGGPARFVAPLLEAYDAESALALTALVDRHYRAPANDGYEAAIDLLVERLRAAGFGDAEGLELRVIETPLGEPAWTPLSARLELVRAGGELEVLHAFDAPEGRDRVMLPVNAPACDTRGHAVLEASLLAPGAALVTDQRLSARLLRRARDAGAAMVLSSSLESFTVDPTGAQRHLDAVAFRSVPAGTELPVAQISPRSHARIAELVRGGELVELSLAAEVRLDTRPLRTVVASFLGATRPEEAVVIASHVQEPGAGDNASGVGGMLEGALTLRRLLASGGLERPARSLDLVWGDEFRQSEAWLEHVGRRPVAAISADMLGACHEQTGAIALLERGHDPGALRPLPPDEHTPWGAGPVDPELLVPNGLAVIARQTLFDVAGAAGGWRTAEHPWEGGSDHDVFLARGVPALLFWHFTDFTYHTGLDRMEVLDAAELERSSVAVLATALAVADARPADLERHLASVALERELWLAAADGAGDADIAAAWDAWCDGAERWLRELCEPAAPAPPTPRSGTDTGGGTDGGGGSGTDEEEHTDAGADTGTDTGEGTARPPGRHGQRHLETKR